MTAKQLWYWVWQLTRYERRYGSLNPEWRYTVIAGKSGNRRLFYYLGMQALQIRMSRHKRHGFRFVCSERFIDDAMVYEMESLERAEHAREMRALTVVVDDHDSVGSAYRAQNARDKLNDDFSDGVKAISKLSDVRLKYGID